MLHVLKVALVALAGFQIAGCYHPTPRIGRYVDRTPTSAGQAEEPVAIPEVPVAPVAEPSFSTSAAPTISSSIEPVPVEPAVVSIESTTLPFPPPTSPEPVIAPTLGTPPISSRSTWPAQWVNAWIPLEAWAGFNGLGRPQEMPSNPHPIFEVPTRFGPLALKIGRAVASCGGAECLLARPPQLVRGVPYVHSLDAQKTLQPLVDAWSWRRSPTPTIVIDPGHGGRDGGAESIVNREREKTYTLDWALRLRSLLEAAGWRVVLTRDRDLDLPLAQRVAIADAAAADVFLSLHFNSGGRNRDLAGLETFCLTPVGMPSHVTRDYDDDRTEALPNNRFDDENVQLAFSLHRALLRSTAVPDRGIRRARFMGVLRTQHRPAALIEGGYLTHPEEAHRVASPDYRQLLAESVVRGLEAWRRGVTEP